MEPFKNMYNREMLDTFASRISRFYPEFNSSQFISTVMDENWENKELKGRMHHIAVTLGKFLPENYPEAVKILQKIKPEMSGFGSIILPEFTKLYGIDYFDESVEALKIFTVNSSSEFAVRPFIIKYGDRMMQVMESWSRDENEHVRRLSTEGCRPRLPWAEALPAFKKNPEPVIRILDNLKDDPSEYVRKSVANNLNDISKDHPDIVMEIAEKWKGSSPERDKIVKHALRTLLKKGDTRAMHLFGFKKDDNIEVTDFSIDNPVVTIGDSFNFSFKTENKSDKPLKVRTEYKIVFMKKNNRTGSKIFQIFEKKIPGGSNTITTRKHKFEDNSIRTHHSGAHSITLILNGHPVKTIPFELN